MRTHEQLFRHCKQQKVALSVLIFMWIKSNLTADTVRTGRYAVAAPRASDIVTGALRQAFGAPGEEQDFRTLLSRIDLAERNCRHA